MPWQYRGCKYTRCTGREASADIWTQASSVNRRLGDLTQKQIFQELPPVGLDWITAMRKDEIRAVVEQKQVQMSLFD